MDVTKLEFSGDNGLEMTMGPERAHALTDSYVDYL